MKKHWHARLTALFLVWLSMGFGSLAMAKENSIVVEAAQYPVSENGAYTSMEEVAVYLAAYHHLPANFVTKRQAEALGWNNRLGNLDEVSPGSSIGGDHFGNYENVLPSAKNRKWTECDIHYHGGYRGGERIAFSNDALIYFSDDHYNTFTQVQVVAGEGKAPKKENAVKVKKNGKYTSVKEVAAYLHKYGKLPSNYLTKAEAKKLGWSNKKDNLGNVAPDCAIGGDSFQNREKLLPEKKGRSWAECDVGSHNGKRGKERIVYSSDGLIYYSPDNHKSFTQLYD
ncbi:MAG: ribonuclease domain-containing protein [Clostridia bacterium]